MLVKYSRDPFYGLVDFFDTFSSFEKAFSSMQAGNIAISGDNIPKMNMYFSDDDKKFIVEAVLAGFNKNDVRVFIKKNNLCIEHTANKNTDEKGLVTKNNVFKEISYSSFKRKVAIPDSVDIDSAQSKYEDGVLTITFDTKEEKVKEITF